jgi:enamine deaminase RidA (YjgF/YER057c/UK114 family)
MQRLNRRPVLALGLAFTAAVLPPRGTIAQPASGSAEQRLRDRGIALPRIAPVPGINNVFAVRTGNLVFLSGLGPRRFEGGFETGKVGRDVTVEQAYQHARLTGLGLLSVLRDFLGGSLDPVVRVVKVFGMVNAMPEFTEHPRVINGCSDLFVEVFGEERGRHARTAVGMASLPFGITVEIEAIFEVG